MTRTEKKSWTTPKLKILVRTRPEENVLAACKATKTGTGDHGPLHTNSGCYQTTICVLCSTVAST